MITAKYKWHHIIKRGQANSFMHSLFENFLKGNFEITNSCQQIKDFFHVEMVQKSNNNWNNFVPEYTTPSLINYFATEKCLT